MGHDQLRHDKECQNCGHTVEEIYCPHCGQKNTETRQSFAHLIGHFAEDLTHYDGAFWKTIKYLLFRPAFLTKEYLIGKRQMYVPPVKLYIFISFIAFLIPAILPDFSEETAARLEKRSPNIVEIEPEKKPDLTKKENVWINGIEAKGQITLKNPLSYKSEKEMDSIENLKADSLKLDTMEYRMAKKLIKLYHHNTPEQVGEKFSNSMAHNIPKIIFIYMPIFAFWLWLFHGKKRWYFFDHGIFTLHYFSFLLLNMTIIIVLSNIFTGLALLIENQSIEFILIAILPFYFLWLVFYFYRSHRKMYHESWFINFIKSSLMFIINITSIIFLMIAAGYFTYYNLH